MSTIGLIARNDLRRQFVQPLAWGLLALVCALFAWQFLVAVDAFLQAMPKLATLANAPGVTDLVALPLLRNASAVLLFVVPLLTMQSLVGERRAQTLPLLLAADAGSLRIVLGKFLGAFVVVALVVALAVAMPLSLAAGTTLDCGRLFTAAIGILLFAGTLTAIGIACSAWTAHPALAAAATLVIGSVLVMLDVGARLRAVDHALINWLAMSSHLEPFLRGVLDSSAVVYFVVISTLALLLAARRLDTLRSRG
ncbi:MAG TPA: ABC transporter permease [Dokdonella sp.]|uniref:ABC transporter permease n=1 Tax=Dokdonella sp. TaxID=2291710 RepID=UPI0025C3D5A2|nr:ABC transporter permease subunit [Dokdonella sp.]MBX3691543.1 ABC transporter permease [Dokdonella sp.]MCW5568400.1 ABC transporter permease [Dokdonella sp.]HNR92018.1 ABC transporter permease [Dokdonella sp.]